MSHSCYSISAHHLDACCGTMTNRVVNDSSNMYICTLQLVSFTVPSPESYTCLYYYRIEHCLLFSDIVAEEVEKCGYDRWLGKIHHFMQKDQDISECYQLQNITAHGLQFIYEGVDMNLLLSPHWTRPGDYFKYLSSISPSLRFRFVHRTIHVATTGIQIISQ
jgi:hypothetical protein